MSENYNTDDLKFNVSFNFDQLKGQLNDLKNSVATLTDNMKGKSYTIPIDTKQAAKNVEALNKELINTQNITKNTVSTTQSMSSAFTSLGNTLKNVGTGSIGGIASAFENLKNRWTDFKSKFTPENLSSGLEKIKNSALIAVPGVEGLVDTFSKFTSVQGWVELGAQALTKFYGVVMEGLGTLNDLESAMVRIGDSFSDQEREQYIPQFSEEIRQLAVDTGTSIPKLTEGLDTIADSGVALSDAMDMLKISRQAASATGVDISQTSEAITNIMNNMDVSAQEAADALFTLKDTARLSFTELDTAMRKIMPLAANLGINIQELGGILEVLGQKGMKGKQGVAGIESLLSSFADEKIADKFRHLGIEVVDAFGKVNDLGSIMNQALQKGLSDADLRKILPSDQAVKVFDILIEESKNAGGEIVSSLESSMAGFSPEEMAGALGHATELVGETTNKLQAKLTAQWEETKAKLAEPFQGFQDTWIKIETTIAAIIPYIATMYGWIYKASSYLVLWPVKIAEWITGADEVEDSMSGISYAMNNATLAAKKNKEMMDMIKDDAEQIKNLSSRTGVDEALISSLKDQKDIYAQIADLAGTTTNNERQRLQVQKEINNATIVGLTNEYNRQALVMSSAKANIQALHLDWNENQINAFLAPLAERINVVHDQIKDAISDLNSANTSIDTSLRNLPPIMTDEERKKAETDAQKAADAQKAGLEKQRDIIVEILGINRQLNTESIDDKRQKAIAAETAALESQNNKLKELKKSFMEAYSAESGTPSRGGVFNDPKLMDALINAGYTSITQFETDVRKTWDNSKTEIENIMAYLETRQAAISVKRQAELNLEYDALQKIYDENLKLGDLEKAIVDATTPEQRRQAEYALQQEQLNIEKLKAIESYRKELHDQNVDEAIANELIKERSAYIDAQNNKFQNQTNELAKQYEIASGMTEEQRKLIALRQQGFSGTTSQANPNTGQTEIVGQAEVIRQYQITTQYLNQANSMAERLNLAKATNEYEEKLIKYQQDGMSALQAGNLVNDQRLIDQAKEAVNLKNQLDLSLATTEIEKKKVELRQTGLYTEDEILKILTTEAEINTNNIKNNIEKQIELMKALTAIDKRRVELNQQGITDIGLQNDIIGKEASAQYAQQLNDLNKQLDIAKEKTELEKKEVELRQTGLYITNDQMTADEQIAEVIKLQGQIIETNILQDLDKQIALSETLTFEEKKREELRQKGIFDIDQQNTIIARESLSLSKQQIQNLNNQLAIIRAQTLEEKRRLELSQQGITDPSQQSSIINNEILLSFEQQKKALEDQTLLNNALTDEARRRLELSQTTLYTEDQINKIIQLQNDAMARQRSDYETDLAYRAKIAEIDRKIVAIKNDTSLSEQQKKDQEMSLQLQRQELDIQKQLVEIRKEKEALGYSGEELERVMDTEESILRKDLEIQNVDEKLTNNLTDRIKKLREEVMLEAEKDELTRGLTDDLEKQLAIQTAKNKQALLQIDNEREQLTNIRDTNNLSQEQIAILSKFMNIKQDATSLDEDQLAILDQQIDDLDTYRGLQVQSNEQALQNIEDTAAEKSPWKQFTNFKDISDELPSQLISLGNDLADTFAGAFSGELDGSELVTSIADSVMQAGTAALSTINPLLGMAANMILPLIENFFNSGSNELENMNRKLEIQASLINNINNALSSQEDYLSFIKEAWGETSSYVSDYIEKMEETIVQLSDNGSTLTFVMEQAEKYVENVHKISKNKVIDLNLQKTAVGLDSYLKLTQDIILNGKTTNELIENDNKLHNIRNGIMKEYQDKLDKGLDTNSSDAKLYKEKLKYTDTLLEYMDDLIKKQKNIESLTTEQAKAEAQAQAEKLVDEEFKLSMITDQNSKEYKNQEAIVAGIKLESDSWEKIYELKKSEEETEKQRIEDLKEANEQAFSDELDLITIKHNANQTNNEEYLAQLFAQDDKMEEGTDELEQQQLVWEEIKNTIDEVIEGITDEASALNAVNDINSAIANDQSLINTIEADTLAAATKYAIGQQDRTWANLTAEQRAAKMQQYIDNYYAKALAANVTYQEALVDLETQKSLLPTATYAGFTEEYEDMERATELLEKQKEYAEALGKSDEEIAAMEDKITADKNTQIEQIDEILANAEELNLTEEEIQDWELKKLDLLTEQTEELEDQNDELDTMDSKLRALYKQRQNLELKAVNTGWTSDLLSQYQNVTNAIAGRMTELGFDTDVINQTLGSASAIPSYDTGGYISNDTLAQLHAGEFVLNKASVEALKNLDLNGMLNSLGSNNGSIINSSNDNNANSVSLYNTINISGLNNDALENKIKTIISTESLNTIKTGLNKVGMNINSLK